MGLIEVLASLAGRILLTMIFLGSGINKITGWEATSNYMASAGMPYVPFFLTGAVILELVGGLLVLLGYRARIGAMMLLLFIIPATFIFHAYWNIPATESGQIFVQRIMFMKNLAIMGGLLMIISLGSGPFSLESRKNR